MGRTRPTTTTRSLHADAAEFPAAPSEPHDPGASRYHDLLQRAFRFAFSLTHDMSDAEDLVQDAWLAVLKADGPRTAPYLMASVRSRFIDQWRRKRVVEMVALEPEHHAASAVAGADLWADDRPLRALSGAVEKALARLSADERASLYLSAVEGYSAREIADLLDRPRGTILSMLFRSREKLRRILAASEVES